MGTSSEAISPSVFCVVFSFWFDVVPASSK